MTSSRPGVARILLQRTGALGDVLCTTPAIRALRLQLGSAAQIDIATEYAALFDDNPDIDTVHGPHLRGADLANYDRVIDLNLAYERHPRMHIVDAYLKAAMGCESGEVDRRIVLKFDTEGYLPFFSPADAARTVVLHAAVTWPNRTMPPEFWGELMERLLHRGYRIIVVGGAQDLSPPPIRDVSNLVNQGLAIRVLASIINKCACFITMDSGLLHLAGATDAPIVAMFTCARAEYRVPYRGGVLGRDVVAITPAVDCYGCLADLAPPVTFCGCRRQDLACLRSFQPDIVMRGIEWAVSHATLRC